MIQVSGVFDHFFTVFSFFFELFSQFFDMFMLCFQILSHSFSLFLDKFMEAFLDLMFFKVAIMIFITLIEETRGKILNLLRVISISRIGSCAILLSEDVLWNLNWSWRSNVLLVDLDRLSGS